MRRARKSAMQRGPAEGGGGDDARLLPGGGPSRSGVVQHTNPRVLQKGGDGGG